MTDEKLIRAKGATRHDLVGMSDEDFETMCARLVRLTFPEARKPANTADGGADMVLPRKPEGYERRWQAKHYPKAIHWEECKKSLATARATWEPRQYTFCFPRDLTAREMQTFDKHFRGPDIDLDVDYWNGEELQARLAGSGEAQRVVRAFFEDSEADREHVYRAIEAGGRLDTPVDALDRLMNIGAVLAGKDAFFSYPASTHEADGLAPGVTPGTVMSVLKSDGTNASRIDVVPRDEESMERYGPKFTVHPTDDAEGARAAERLQEALREGKEIEIDQGLQVTFTQMPPGFKDIVGQQLTGTIKVGRAERPTRVPPPWDAHMRAETGAGTVHLNTVLRQADSVPEGWDNALTGHRGGLTTTVLFRRAGAGGAITWNFTYTRDNSPVREQLAALSFFKAMCGTGEFVVSDRGKTGRPEFRQPTPIGSFDEEMQALLAFLEDLRVIEEYADVEFALPPTILAGDAHRVALVAHSIRQGGHPITWHNFTMTIRREGVQPLRTKRPLRVEHAVSARLFGREIQLGYTAVDIRDFKVVSVTPAVGQPGYMDVRVEPPTPAAASAFQQLLKQRTTARRPPPPPPRKGKRGRRKKKR